MTEKTFPKARLLSAEEFEKQVRVSVAFVSELRSKLAANGLGEAEKRELLVGRAEVFNRELPNRDYIRQLIRGEVD